MNLFARLFVVLFILVSTPALAAKRVALLIGNASYKTSVGPLKNPHNDIRLVGGALRRVGFEVLTPVRDANRTDILVAIHDFAKKLRQAGPDAVGFLYYSGHGVAASGENFIVPVDVAEVSSLRMSLGGVRQTEIVKILRDTAPRAVHYLVFDACRNNLGGARGNKGFVPVRQESGLLVAFATAPGQVATDLGDGGGPYAKALASELVKPGVSDLLMFHRVRIAVKDATNGEQIPWTVDGISRRQRLYLGGSPSQSPTTAKPSKPSKPSSSGEAANAWSVIQETRSSAVLSRFIELYPRSVFAELARARLAELQRTSPPAADGQGSSGTVRLKQNETAPTLDKAELARQLQAELKRVGCLDGTVDGVWGANSQSALMRFQERAGGPPADGPTMAALAAVRSETGQACPAVEVVSLAGRWNCTSKGRSYLAQDVPGIRVGALLARVTCKGTVDAIASGPDTATYSSTEACRARGVHAKTKSFRNSTNNRYKGRMWRKGQNVYVQNTWASSEDPEWDTAWVYSPVPTEKSSFVSHATRYINDNGVRTKVVASAKCVKLP